MTTTVIRVQSEAQRIAAAGAAISRHDALPSESIPYPNVLPCCQTVPEYRQGGAVLTSLTCPMCKRHAGAWTMEVPFVVSNWNRDVMGFRHSTTPLPLIGEGFRLVPRIHLGSHWSFADQSESRGHFTLEWFGAKHEAGLLSIFNPYTGKVAALRPPASGSGLSWSLLKQGECMSDWHSGPIPSHVDAISLGASNRKWHDVLASLIGS